MLGMPIMLNNRMHSMNAIPKIEPVNYTSFGGKDAFDKMVQLAKEHAGEPK